MDDLENNKNNIQDPDTVFSKAVLSGKRIYYLDVKKSRNGELFLVITERKKILSKDSPQSVVFFENNNISVLKEEFDKFFDAFNEALSFIKDNDIINSDHQKNDEPFTDPINLSIDF
jgi:hypothetical protein